MEFSHELILPNDDIPFKMFLFEGREGSYIREKHWHRSVEIFALFHGEIDFFLNETRHHMRPGDFILVNSNEIHSIHAPHRNVIVVLQIPLTAFEKYYTEEQFIYFFNSIRIHDAEIMQIIEDMYNAYVIRDTGYELKVLSAFYLLLYLLVTKYRRTEISSDVIRRNKGLGRLAAITGYMKENYRKNLSLEEVAKTFGYSPNYLSRMFQKYARTSYKTYLDHVRLQYAYKELINTSEKIGEIALKHGFSNSKSFAKVFQREYGMTPGEYRKRIRNCHEVDK